MIERAAKGLNPERRDRILAAAEDLFLRNGLRATSMEAIARAADVAKPTLYAYFSDKDTVFGALAEGLFEEWRILIAADLAGPAPAAERIARALTAKYKSYFRLVRASAHAEELFGENTRAAARQTEAFEHWLESAIAEALQRDGHAEPRRFAQLLLACASGLCARAHFAEEIGPAMRLVVDKLLA